METFERYGTEEHKRQWLDPLLEGKIRSAFLMTEPDVASSDATNIQCRIKREGDHYVINGRKWWSSGAGDSRCKIYILMGKTDPDNTSRHAQQSMILVPADTPGVKILRYLPVFGYDDAPHGHMEIELKDVRVPASNILLGEGRGFEIAQGRLGPGRIHHCMRLIGQAERALEKMCKRATQRVAFGRSVAEQGVTRERIAEARIMIDSARFMVLHAAWKMDKSGNKVAKKDIAMIKVLAPTMACQVIDWAMQVHGGGAVSDDFGLSFAYAHARTLRFADGPDEVHRNAIAKLEIAEQTTLAEALAQRRA
jgi:acyl-CoA dehydrogenase